LLDSYGDERLGKAIGGDILEGKKTFLTVTAMSHADETTREELRNLLADNRMAAEQKIASVKAIYDRLDVPHLAEQQIELRFERALAQLDTLSADVVRTAPLREFAIGLLGRNK
ncbi:MAG: polyprenyl synthetase family protein, partial [Alistipes sp.]|nr:polyprenyl synthetase family protein [Alistipes sp.]